MYFLCVFILPDMHRLFFNYQNSTNLSFGLKSNYPGMKWPNPYKCGLRIHMELSLGNFRTVDSTVTAAALLHASCWHVMIMIGHKTWHYWLAARWRWDERHEVSGKGIAITISILRSIAEQQAVLFFFFCKKKKKKHGWVGASSEGVDI